MQNRLCALLRALLYRSLKHHHFEELTIRKQQILFISHIRTIGIPSVWCVMSSAMIQAESSWKTNTRLQSAFLDQGTTAIFDQVCNFGHGHSRAYVFPCALSNLPMNLCGTTDALVCDLWVFHCHSFIVTFLFGRRPPCIATNKTWSISLEDNLVWVAIRTRPCRAVSPPLGRHHS